MREDRMMVRGRRRWAGLGAAFGVVLPLILAGCGSDTPPAPVSFTPLSYSYLQPLRLNVGSIEVDDDWSPAPGSKDISGQSPAIPAEALGKMARDRLVASGASGRAAFTVEDASIVADGDQLNGRLKVRLDIFGSNGARSAFAEATVARSASGPSDDAGLQPALYALTRQMMSDMNVEFEFQLRRSLGDWMQAGALGVAPPPAPVEQQPLDQPASRLVPVMPGAAPP